MIQIPPLKSRVRYRQNSAMGTVTDVFRAFWGDAWYVRVTLDDGSVMPCRLTRFATLWEVLPEAQIINLSDYRPDRERRGLRAMAASLAEGPSCA